MNAFRESLRAILNFERHPDLCQFEWGYWPETIARWKSEGMAADLPWEALPITFYERAPFRMRVYPPFEEQVLAETATTRTIRTTTGVVLEHSKLATGMPHFIEFPVKNLRDFEQYKEASTAPRPAASGPTGRSVLPSCATARASWCWAIAKSASSAGIGT